MANSLRFFKNLNSPFIINKPTGLSTSLASDWEREGDQQRLTINGEQLSYYKKEYNNFQTLDDVKRFFLEIILKDMSSVSDEEKAQAVSYLEKTFYQGGLMYPVSNSISLALKGYFPQGGKEINYATLDTRKIQKKINIVTTSSGFKMQEFVDVESLNIISTCFSDELNQLVDGEDRLHPAYGNKYIIEAQGVIHVDFSSSTANPELKVESNTVNFNHPFLETNLDNRTIFQTFIDLIMTVLKLNVVKSILPNEEHTALRADFI